MQAMMLFLSQSQPKELTTNSKPSTALAPTEDGNEVSLFTDLLSGKMQETENSQQPETATKSLPETSDVIEDLRMALLELDKGELLDLLKKLVVDLNEPILESKSLRTDGLIEEVLQQLTHLPTNEIQMIIADLNETNGQMSEAEELPLNLHQEKIQDIGKNELSSIHLELGKSYFPVVIQGVSEQMLVEEENNAMSFEQIEELLAQIETLEDIKQVAPKLLNALIRWNPPTESVVTAASNSAMALNGGKQTPQIWEELVQLYQQKMSFHSKNVYSLDSKISSSDIVRWLSKILGASLQAEQQGTNTAQVKAPVMPMEKVEQFMIQLPAKAEAKTQERSMIEQFQRLVDGNRPVLMQPKGQLAITLKPANLGEMLVRFTQVDGETMVKILVTTATAKEMLEGNLKQLRHMFAPHQVVIERQEVATPQTEGTQKEKQHDEEEDRQGQPRENDNEKKDDDETGTFSSMFEELILNEKV